MRTTHSRKFLHSCKLNWTRPILRSTKVTVKLNLNIYSRQCIINLWLKMKSVQEKGAIIHQSLCRIWWNDYKIQTTAVHWLHSTIPSCLITSFGGALHPTPPHPNPRCSAALLCVQRYPLWNRVNNVYTHAAQRIYWGTLCTDSLFICINLGANKQAQCSYNRMHSPHTVPLNGCGKDNKSKSSSHNASLAYTSVPIVLTMYYSYF